MIVLFCLVFSALMRPERTYRQVINQYVPWYQVPVLTSVICLFLVRVGTSTYIAMKSFLFYNLMN